MGRIDMRDIREILRDWHYLKPKGQLVYIFAPKKNTVLKQCEKIKVILTLVILVKNVCPMKNLQACTGIISIAFVKYANRS